jgi:hypothetical protein
MASNTFNISALYQQVFGVTGVTFNIPQLVENTFVEELEIAEYAAGIALNDAQYQAGLTRQQLYQGIQSIPQPTAANIQSVLGTPIYEQITLTIPATVTNGVQTSPQQTYTFPDWPLFDITGAKTIEKTKMQNFDGSVKEYISDDDFQITIRGFLINYDSQAYPEDLFNAFAKLLKAKVTLGITSQVFNLLNIHNIVITDYRLPGVEGYPNIQPFELDCLSDAPVELLIKSVKTQRPIVQGL